MKNSNIYIEVSGKTRSLKKLEDLGGKAANLYKLKSLDLSIPKWIVIKTTLMKHVLSGKMAEINNIISHIDYNSIDSLNKSSEKIKHLILNQNIEEELIDFILLTARRNFKHGTLLAVRSSVVDEDSKDNSFAGQMETFLNVKSEDIIKYIKLVWSSAFSENALIYRYKKNILNDNIKCAVIIQEMVKPESSGIIFTRNPDNGNNESIISAVFGLGEGVVNNTVESDTFKVPNNCHEYTSKIEYKNWGIYYDEMIGKNVQKKINKLKAGQPVLTGTQIFELINVALKIEKLLNAPVDIEWCYDFSGKLTILQARPITFKQKQTETEGFTIWDNSNIVESYPGITLPLTFSLMEKAYQRSFKNVILKIVPFDQKLQNNPHLFNNMIGYFNGRVYYNLTNWYKVMSYLPNFKNYKNNWDKMIGISKKVEFPVTNLSIVNKLYSIFEILKRLFFLKGTTNKFFKKFNPINNFYQHVDYESKSINELITLFRSLDRKASKIWYLTLFNDFCAIKYYGWLKSLCINWFNSSRPNLENELLCNVKAMESIKPLKAVFDLAEIIKSDINYLKLFQNDDNGLILKNIKSLDCFTILRNHIDEYLSKYGDRSIEELKLETKGYREKPEEFIKLIKKHLALRKTYSEIYRNEQKISRIAMQHVNDNLKNPFKKLVFKFILLKARKAISERENMRFARSRLFGIIRRIFNRIGDIFEDKKIIERDCDIHYLTIDEVFDYIEGTSLSMNLNTIIKTRKDEFKSFKKMRLPDRFITDEIPYLNMIDCDQADEVSKNHIRGIGCSSGIIEGKTKVILDPKQTIKEKEYILLAESTDPGWVFHIASARGIIVERGSILSHSAIIGRELGIPAIVGAKNAIDLIGDDRKVIMNGASGVIRWN